MLGSSLLPSVLASSCTTAQRTDTCMCDGEIPRSVLADTLTVLMRREPAAPAVHEKTCSCVAAVPREMASYAHDRQRSTTQTHLHTAFTSCAGQYMSRACSRDQIQASLCYYTTAWHVNCWVSSNVSCCSVGGFVQPRSAYGCPTLRRLIARGGRAINTCQ